MPKKRPSRSLVCKGTVRQLQEDDQYSSTRQGDLYVRKAGGKTTSGGNDGGAARR